MFKDLDQNLKIASMKSFTQNEKKCFRCRTYISAACVEMRDNCTITAAPFVADPTNSVVSEKTWDEYTAAVNTVEQCRRTIFLKQEQLKPPPMEMVQYGQQTGWDRGSYMELSRATVNPIKEQMDFADKCFPALCAMKYRVEGTRPRDDPPSITSYPITDTPKAVKDGAKVIGSFPRTLTVPELMSWGSSSVVVLAGKQMVEPVQGGPKWVELVSGGFALIDGILSKSHAFPLFSDYEMRIGNEKMTCAELAASPKCPVATSTATCRGIGYEATRDTSACNADCSAYIEATSKAFTQEPTYRPTSLTNTITDAEGGVDERKLAFQPSYSSSMDGSVVTLVSGASQIAVVSDDATTSAAVGSRPGGFVEEGLYLNDAVPFKSIYSQTGKQSGRQSDWRPKLASPTYALQHNNKPEVARIALAAKTKFAGTGLLKHFPSGIVQMSLPPSESAMIKIRCDGEYQAGRQWNGASWENTTYKVARDTCSGSIQDRICKCSKPVEDTFGIMDPYGRGMECADDTCPRDPQSRTDPEVMPATPGTCPWSNTGTTGNTTTLTCPSTDSLLAKVKEEELIRNRFNLGGHTLMGGGGKVNPGTGTSTTTYEMTCLY